MEKNREQEKAVRHGEGPLLVVAGAGTGKTSVIVRRIAHLIETKKAKPSEILALTFTDKAASEMEERVDLLVPYGFADVRISTFHAFGDRALREHCFEAGLSPDFQVLSQAEAVVLLREHLWELPLDFFRPLSNPTRYLWAVIHLISRAKDELVSPQDYLAFAQKLASRAKGNPEIQAEARKHEELARLYEKYESLKDAGGFIDFGDQGVRLFGLFKNPAILKKYQEQFRYILVDEFQDTNFAQFELVKMLAQHRRNLTVVGDDDQCLPPGTAVATPEGDKSIETIKTGDEVLTAIGRGHIGISRVTRVFTSRKRVRLLTFETQRGYRVTVTDNHKMFCFIPPVTPTQSKSICYVYLMYGKDFGWRLGVTNNLPARLRLERQTDIILGIKACPTEQEARYYEVLYSLTYGIPTATFKSRNGNVLTGQWLQRLFAVMDTRKNALRLCQDLKIDINAHHFSLGATYRGKTARVRVLLEMCYRGYSLKNSRGNPVKSPPIFHQVSLETSDREAIKRLLSAGIPITQARKGMRFRALYKRLEEAGAMAMRLQEITGSILECRFCLGTSNIQHRHTVVMPASNILIGHSLPILNKGRVIYDKIIKRTESFDTLKVYDLEAEGTHNYIADGVVVHNSIYKFRGACLSNILGFLKVYPDARKVVITQNYRSPQGILDASYRLIRHNDPERLEVKNKISKKLKTSRKETSPPRVHTFEKAGEEADFAAQRIWDAVQSRHGDQEGMRFSQFAILVRSNDDAEPFLQALAAKGIPFQFSGASGFAAHPEVKELVLFLRAVANPHEDISLFYTAAMPPWEIPMSDLALFSESAREKGISLYSFLKSDGNAGAKKFVEDMEKYLLASRRLSTGKLLYKFMEESGRVKKMGEQNEENIQRLARLFQAASRFSQIAPLDRVREFVRVEEEMLADISEDKMDFSLDAVSVLTVHKAKGLEFDVVFMVSLVEEKFPVRRHGEGVALPAELAREILPPGDTHMAEERRLFYVGMTRAKKELILTSAKDYGGKRLRKVSRFIQEALDLPAARVKSESAKKESEILLFREEKPRPLILRGDLKLNASSIHEYLTCPLRYKYRNIIEWPVESHYTQVYGTALHKAIEVFHRAQLEGKEAQTSEAEEAYKKNWRGKGFLSREHEEKLYENGLKVLREYLSNLAPPKEEIAGCEERFSFQEGNVEIRGRWDRLDHRGKNWVIVDLKSTTRVETEEDAKEAAREPGTQRQAAIYILGFLRKKSFLPKGFEVLFLQSGQRAEIPASEKLLEKAVSSIGDAARGISARDFPAKPSAYICGHCPYRIVCPESAA